MKSFRDRERFLQPMTRFIFTISVFFSLVFLGDLERAAAQRAGLGVTGGGNLSTHTRTFRLDDSALQMDLEPEFRSGFHYGIVLRRVLSDHVRLQLEPRFVPGIGQEIVVIELGEISHRVVQQQAESCDIAAVSFGLKPLDSRRQFMAFHGTALQGRSRLL